MKLSKPEYNENVVDVDALEKLRIQQEAETERNLVLQQELTKREAICQKEQTKRDPAYSEIRNTFIVSFAVAIIVAAIAGSINLHNYLDVLKIRAGATDSAIIECPKVTCQPVPVMQLEF